jgi:prepilin-type N-terminal cleavage/methylation domain-containing protein
MTIVRRITHRLRAEEGFTLIELMLAMVILTVGILALVAAYSSGYVALKRATRVSSATLLADSQMERFRALQYSAIQLNTSCANCAEDSTYTADASYSSANQITGCATIDSSCLPTQTPIGPDNKSYRMDTFIDWACATGTYSSGSCSSGQNPVKVVTVVVRKSGGGTWLREQSAFTSLTGS